MNINISIRRIAVKPEPSPEDIYPGTVYSLTQGGLYYNIKQST